jgi:hypothetical protein
MTDRECQRLEQLGSEAHYQRQRLDLYRARLYGGRALSLARLEEFERASDGAATRLRQASEAASRPASGSALGASSIFVGSG